MPSSGILRHVVLVRTDVSEEVVPSSRVLVTLMMGALGSFETVLTRAMRRNIPEDSILKLKIRQLNLETGRQTV
jgi:hypothetical protein